MNWESLHTEKQTSLAHLGVTATHVRRIASGKEYEKYFTPSNLPDKLVNPNATTTDTLAFVKTLVNETLNDTMKIAPVLKRATLQDTCQAIFDFFYKHYQYKLDEFMKEQVRRPSRAWADRKNGIDCDCFTASVSSVLTNLGIAHYLKIIAIEDPETGLPRENFQHIYVVVPKRIDLDINQRGNYWIIDPVLNRFNEEAPRITKTKHLKMEGIPLYQLNGIDDAGETYGGLGNEFENLDTALNGLSDEDMGRVFTKRLGAHIRNTRRKIENDPRSVEALYKPQVLVSQLRTLEGALNGTNEQLFATLGHLSNVEHEAIQPALAGDYDELHGHDDELYGALFGFIDDRMLDAVDGLGKKGGGNRASKRAAKKETKKAAKKAGKTPGKKGFFTKVKNAAAKVKSAAKSGKLKTVIKKVGRFLKKTNPLAMAARGGFIMAMRTNFAKMAEKAWWGYQTWEYAKSKGITEDFYKACVDLLNKIKRVYIDKLGGNESAIKKPIMNGRAAKKIAKAAKKKGMSGLDSLYGLGDLGVATAAASATTITAAMAFITPILAWIKKAFKGKKGGVVNENGTESEAPSENAAEEMDNTSAEASNPSDTLIENDNSIEAADAANDEPPSDDDGQKKNRRVLTPEENAKYEQIAQEQGTDAAEKYAAAASASKASEGRGGSEGDEGEPAANSQKSGSGGMIVGAAILTTVAAIAIAKKKKKPQETSGLGAAKKNTQANKVKIVKL